MIASYDMMIIFVFRFSNLGFIYSNVMGNRNRGVLVINCDSSCAQIAHRSLIFYLWLFLWKKVPNCLAVKWRCLLTVKCMISLKNLLRRRYGPISQQANSNWWECPKFSNFSFPMAIGQEKTGSTTKTISRNDFPSFYDDQRCV